MRKRTQTYFIFSDDKSAVSHLSLAIDEVDRTDVRSTVRGSAYWNDQPSVLLVGPYTKHHRTTVEHCKNHLGNTCKTLPEVLLETLQTILETLR